MKASVVMSDAEYFYSRFTMDMRTWCWNWNGSVDKNGYGQIHVKKKGFKAHRYSYIFHYGDIKGGMVIRHKCDNPRCVNPKHLILGTQQDNINDCMLRGRKAAGGNHYHSKLSDEEIELLLKMWSEGYRAEDISEKLPVSGSAISAIILGKSRSYLFERIRSMNMRYPHPENHVKNIYWKRSSSGWKSFIRRRENVRIIATKDTNRRCTVCGTEFVSYNSCRLYCSGRCSGRAFRSRHCVDAGYGI